MNKDINKSDSVLTEAAQLLQSFDDVSAVFGITEAKLTAVSNKVSARLAPDVVELCVSPDGDAAQQEKGLKVVAALRSLKMKLSAALPLIQSLTATKGEMMHHSALENALQSVKMAGIKTTSALDDMLAVRHVTALAESQDWDSLFSKLTDGLEALADTSKTQVVSGGCVHAIETIMRPCLAEGDEVQTDAKHSVAAARCSTLVEFVQRMQKSPLWQRDDIKNLCDCLHHLEGVCAFAVSEVEGHCRTSERIKEVEAGRAILFRKESPLLKCLTAFPLGAWLGDLLQESLAEYHAQTALASAFISASLEFSTEFV